VLAASIFHFGEYSIAEAKRGGIACHTGRHNCFFQRFEDGGWRVVEPVLKDPGEMYGGNS
jgi:phosphoribosyl-AMP cyclohydrolase